MSERDPHLSHNEASDEARNPGHSLVIPYLAGELSTAEESLFEQPLLPGTPDAQELEDSMEALTLLAEKIADTMPAPRKALKDRVLAAAVASTDRLRAEKSYEHLLREQEGQWFEEPGAPGIHVKVLYEDKRNQYYTVLVKLGAGVVYPPHRHVGREQCYVISGDIHVDDILLNSGDFITTEDGTEHASTYSEHGCTLLLTTKLVDEILA